MPRGRKRKQGKRTPSGQLSRAKGQVVSFDRGTERAQQMREFYGEDCTDAIGRAYQSGLLGQGSEAKALLDTARKLFLHYWRAYEVGPIGCTLGDRTGGGSGHIDHDRVRQQEQQLQEDLCIVRGMGELVRKSFTELVIDPNPDHGPAWCDDLCFKARTRKQGEAMPGDPRMRAALDALERLANVG